MMKNASQNLCNVSVYNTFVPSETMAGILSDIQQIYEWIVYFNDIYDTIESNKVKCQTLIHRCSAFEGDLNQLDRVQGRHSARVGNGVKVLREAVGDCKDFIDKYGKKSIKRFVYRMAFPHAIDAEFLNLNALLTQASFDLQFALIVVLPDQIVDTLTDHQRSSALLDYTSRDENAAARNPPSVYDSLKFAVIDMNLLQWDKFASNVVGKGTFSTVYRALYETRPCAVKHFENAHALTDRAMRSIRKEACVMQLARHVNVIGFIGYSEVASIIVSELAIGSLHDVLHKGLRVVKDCSAIETKLGWMIDIAQALRYLHIHGIIHRDIKPQNILMVNDAQTANVVAKVSDFGISTAVGMSIGSTNTVVGSTAYMAPELFNFKGDAPVYTSAVDIYAFGVLVNEMLLGEIPWENVMETLIIAAKMKKKRPKAFVAGSDAEKRLMTLVAGNRGCWANDVKMRPIAGDVVKDLQKAVVVVADVDIVTSFTASASSFHSVKQKADDGDGLSQCQIGLCYLVGHGAKKSTDRFVLWALSTAVSTGMLVDVEQICTLDLEPNHAEALTYFKKAADLRHSCGQWFTGYCHEYGLGTNSKDFRNAFAYYKMSADQGNSTGQCYVGHCYRYRRGVALDNNQAFKYYKLSADQLNAEGQCHLGLCFRYGKGTAVSLEDAFLYYKLSADQGYDEAECNLGLCYRYGRGTMIVDHIEAFKLFKRSADKGYANGQFNAGLCYETGIGTDKNLTEALKYYKLSADQGNKEAIKRLAR